jgi:hypothetical protein
MLWNRMDTAPPYRLRLPHVASLQSKLRNGMEEVVGSIPTRSTKFIYFKINNLAKAKRICVNFVQTPIGEHAYMRGKSGNDRR